MLIKSCRQVWGRSPTGRGHVNSAYQTVTDGDRAGPSGSHNWRTGLVRKLSGRWHATAGGGRAALGGVTGGVREGALGAGEHAVVGRGDRAVGEMFGRLHELRLDGRGVDTLVVEELLHFLCYLQIIIFKTNLLCYFANKDVDCSEN